MSGFDLTAFTPPLRVPELVRPPVVLRPYAVSDLAMVRRASADPLIPSISSVPRRYTDDAGRAFIARQHTRDAEGDGYSFVIAPESEPTAGIGSWCSRPAVPMPASGSGRRSATAEPLPTQR